MRNATFLSLRLPLLAVPFLSLAMVLAVATFLSPATAGAGKTRGPIVPVFTGDGKLLRTKAGFSVSSNWSGYALDRIQTGVDYTAASGNWIVPAVSGSGGYSSNWIGIGGSCLNSRCTRVDHTLIQLGTEQDGGGTYYAWYEMLPKFSVRITGYSVNPGDQITASLQMKGNAKKGQTWTLTMTNATQNWTWTQDFTYKSSLASAEWILEAPSVTGPGGGLANFGTATFDLGTVNGGNPGLVPNDGIIMENPGGGNAYPSDPDSDHDGFNVCYKTTVDSSTSCDAPGS